jgi:hypothetical protein
MTTVTAIPRPHAPRVFFERVTDKTGITRIRGPFCSRCAQRIDGERCGCGGAA